MISKAISWIISVAIVVSAGLLLAYTQGITQVTASNLYLDVVYTLLALGLYGSVYSIDKDELSTNRTIVIQAVTAGVLLKILIIGGIIFAFTRNTISLLLAVIVAQIDPLSVARLLDTKSNRLSSKAQTILNAWSSFDDPITVLTAIYIATLIVSHNNTAADHQIYISDYLVSLGLNLFFAAAIYCLNKVLQRFTVSKYILLIFSFAIAVYFQLMLAIAIIGLFIRPNLRKILPVVLNTAFYISLFMLGILLINGVAIMQGILLGTAAIIAQVIVGTLLTRNFRKRDRLHLALSQQNGITAIILSLVFEPNYPGIVSIVAPAILCINIGHTLLNSLLDYLIANRDSDGKGGANVSILVDKD